MRVGPANPETTAAGKAVLSLAREDNFLNLKPQNCGNVVLVRPSDVNGHMLLSSRGGICHEAGYSYRA